MELPILNSADTRQKNRNWVSVAEYWFLDSSGEEWHISNCRSCNLFYACNKRREEIVIFFRWPPPTGSGDDDLLVHVPSRVIALPGCGYRKQQRLHHYLVCLSINNYTTVIILATSPVLLHFNSYSWLVTKLSDWRSLLLLICHHLHKWYYCCS